MNTLPKLPSLQASWLLLCFCAVPHVNHLLRTLPPSTSHQVAKKHDESIMAVFRELFGIQSPREWDETLHGLHYITWSRQAQLPLRHGGCGMRDSLSTRRAAYWASWADSLPDIISRFPEAGRHMLRFLTDSQALDADEAMVGPECLVEAELCGKFCAAQGWRSRPLWIDIAAGLRPPEPSSADIALGEWKHGWQFHASDALAKSSLEVLKRSLSAPSYRSNAATPGKSRLRSCTGPFSSTWMTNCPQLAA